MSACPAAPGRVGGRDGGMRPRLGDGVGDGTGPGGSQAEHVCGVELFCGGRAVGCAGQCLDESKVPMYFPLLLGRGFGVHSRGSSLASKISLLAVKENLGLCRLFFGAGGGGASLSFLEIRQLSLAVGQWAGGAGLATLPPTSVSLSGCELVPKKPKIRGGLFTPQPLTPSLGAGASTVLWSLGF